MPEGEPGSLSATRPDGTTVRDRRTQKIVVVFMAVILALPLMAGAIATLVGG